MAKSLCSLLIYVNHAMVANFNVANISFKAIRENFIYTIFQEGDIFSSTASLPYGPLNI